MKRFFFILMAGWIAISAAQAQTVVSKKIISAQKGFDAGPEIAQAVSGKYIVVWGRAVSSDSVQVFSRPVAANGQTIGAIGNNILGADTYPFTGRGIASLANGGFVVAGTRLVDRQLVARFFDAKFHAKGTTVATGITGYNPHLVQSGNGFLMVNSDGFVQSFASLLDSAGKKATDPVRIVPAAAANGFTASRIVASPAGGFVVAGIERSSDGSKGRASTFYTSADLNSISKPIAHESAFSKNSILGDVAFTGPSALMLFGHAVSDSKTNLSMRGLASKGQNAGGTKKFDTGGTVYSRFLRIISITGSDRYVAAWEDLRGGLFMIQVLNANGTAVSDPFPLSQDNYRFTGAVDMAWDAQTQTLLVVWTENAASQPVTHSDIWFGTFKID